MAANGSESRRSSASPPNGLSASGNALALPRRFFDPTAEHHVAVGHEHDVQREILALKARQAAMAVRDQDYATRKAVERCVSTRVHTVAQERERSRDRRDAHEKEIETLQRQNSVLVQQRALSFREARQRARERVKAERQRDARAISQERTERDAARRQEQIETEVALREHAKTVRDSTEVRISVQRQRSVSARRDEFDKDHQKLEQRREFAEAERKQQRAERMRFASANEAERKRRIEEEKLAREKHVEALRGDVKRLHEEMEMKRRAEEQLTGKRKATAAQVRQETQAAISTIREQILETRKAARDEVAKQSEQQLTEAAAKHEAALQALKQQRHAEEEQRRQHLQQLKEQLTKAHQSAAAEQKKGIQEQLNKVLDEIMQTSMVNYEQRNKAQRAALERAYQEAKMAKAKRAAEVRAEDRQVRDKKRNVEAQTTDQLRRVASMIRESGEKAVNVIKQARQKTVPDDHVRKTHEQWREERQRREQQELLQKQRNEELRKSTSTAIEEAKRSVQDVNKQRRAQELKEKQRRAARLQEERDQLLAQFNKQAALSVDERLMSVEHTPRVLSPRGQRSPRALSPRGLSPHAALAN
jgi:hypothetical protein